MSKELPQNTIKHLQEYVAFKIKERGFEDETLHERMILLCEEVGEVARGVRKISGMNVDKAKEYKSTLGEEIADVINLLFAVAVEAELDMEEEYRKKEKEVDERFYERSSK